MTTTDFAVFEDGVQVAGEVIEHSRGDLYALLTPPEQALFRFNAMMKVIGEKDIRLDDVDLIITQTYFIELPPGIYLVNSELLDFLKGNKLEQNPFRSGVFVVNSLTTYINEHYDSECMPLVVQPAISNEITPEASLSGIKEITRSPVFHAFSQRAAASLYATATGRKGRGNESWINAVIAHLGTEISVGAHAKGKILDANSPLDGEGPFSPTTSGSLPVDSLVDLCYSGKYDMDEIMHLINKGGGLAAHLGISKLEEVREACRNGDTKARSLVAAMAYGVAKEIAARAVALRGDLEQIILTGPWALFEEFTDAIREHTEWIAPVSVHVWKSELFMLSVAAEETFKGNNKILLYGKNIPE